MCGVFGYVGKSKEGAQIVLTGLKKLEYRGYDSWGIAEKDGGKIALEKYAGKIGEAKTTLPKSSLALGHTRWATHGGVTDVNAHPHLDCRAQIAIIHNGIIENFSELKARLMRGGHKFVSETDSEVAAHLIEEYAKRHDFVEAVRKAFGKLAGLNAIVALDILGERLVCCKNGSPLVVGFGKGENFVASDAPALLSHTKEVVFLEDGQLASLGRNEVEFFDLESGKKIFPKIQRLSLKEEDVAKGKYPHFMLKEIFEQPRVTTYIADNLGEQIKSLAMMVKKAYGTYLVGCGTAYHACLFGQYAFSKLSKRHVNSVYGSEFSYLEDFITPKSLVLALSQSGETIDIVESVGKAKKRGVRVAAIVNNLGSTLYRMADFKILLSAGPERAVASTKAFTAKMAVLVLLSYDVAGKLWQGKKLLINASRETGRILNLKARILKIAKKIKNASDIYIIGRGISHPIALEAALKIKEISYIHAEGFAAGELKHGVIALIEKGTPCIVFAPCDETYGAVMFGAMELRARGGYIIGVSSKNHEVFDEFIKVEDCEEATAIPSVVVAQLLAYYLAVLRGNNPDMPRNLAKSVTVK